MTSINTIEDFLRVVRENDDLRSAVRRELLTEELLALPGRFSEMLKTQNAMLEEQRSMRQDSNALRETQNAILEDLKSLRQDSDALRRDSDSLRETQSAMLEDLKSLREDSNALRRDTNALRRDSDSLREAQNALLETVATMLKELSETRRDIGALHGMYRRQHDDLARFRGNYAIYAARRNSYQIARPFFRQKGMRRVEFSTLDSSVLNGMLNESYEALDALDLSDDTLNSFPEADLIISVADRSNSTQRFYIAVEASFTGHNYDVRRATDRARILRCATGLDAYAVVAAVRLDQHINRDYIHENITTYLGENSENDALWYELSETGLEPPDPY